MPIIQGWQNTRILGAVTPIRFAILDSTTVAGTLGDLMAGRLNTKQSDGSTRLIALSGRANPSVCLTVGCRVSREIHGRLGQTAG